MGMEQTVSFAADRVPSWESIRDLLAGHGFAVQMRMIDGELAFPDEKPPAAWRELRVGTPQGMISLRRQGDSLVLVTWGNADAGLRQAWNALTWACAEAGGGLVQTPAGPQSAAEYGRAADLPPGLRGPAGGAAP
jgi:hypothetical protein